MNAYVYSHEINDGAEYHVDRDGVAHVLELLGRLERHLDIIKTLDLLSFGALRGHRALRVVRGHRPQTVFLARVSSPRTAVR